MELKEESTDVSPADGIPIPPFEHKLPSYAERDDDSSEAQKNDSDDCTKSEALESCGQNPEDTGERIPRPLNWIPTKDHLNLFLRSHLPHHLRGCWTNRLAVFLNCEDAHFPARWTVFGKEFEINMTLAYRWLFIAKSSLEKNLRSNGFTRVYGKEHRDDNIRRYMFPMNKVVVATKYHRHSATGIVDSTPRVDWPPVIDPSGRISTESTPPPPPPPPPLSRLSPDARMPIKYLQSSGPSLSSQMHGVEENPTLHPHHARSTVVVAAAQLLHPLQTSDNRDGTFHPSKMSHGSITGHTAQSMQATFMYQPSSHHDSFLNQGSSISVPPLTYNSRSMEIPFKRNLILESDPSSTQQEKVAKLSSTDESFSHYLLNQLDESDTLSDQGVTAAAPFTSSKLAHEQSGNNLSHTSHSELSPPLMLHSTFSTNEHAKRPDRIIVWSPHEGVGIGRENGMKNRPMERKVEKFANTESSTSSEEDEKDLSLVASYSSTIHKRIQQQDTSHRKED